jgi:hypothetical protein
VQAVFVLVAGSGAFIMYWAAKGHTLSQLVTALKGVVGGTQSVGTPVTATSSASTVASSDTSTLD